MEDASNTVQILVACAMHGIRFSSIIYLRWGGTKETGSQMKVCAMYIIRFTWMNCLWLGNTKERSARLRCVRCMTCGSPGWTVCVETREQKRFNVTNTINIARLKFKDYNAQIHTLHAASFLKWDQPLTSHAWVWHNNFQLLCHMIFQYEVWHFLRHFHSTVPAGSDNHTMDLS